MKRLVCECKQPDYFERISAFLCLAFNWCGYRWKRCRSNVPSTWRKNSLSARCTGPLGFRSQFQWCHLAVVALKLWNWFSSSSISEGPYPKKSGFRHVLSCTTNGSKSKGSCACWTWRYFMRLLFSYFPVYFFDFLVYHLSLLPHRSDRFDIADTISTQDAFHI